MGALPLRVALDVLAQISRGLQLAHVKGIVHRDIKPANVFMHRPGSGALEPKVLDFGISKIVGAGGPQVALTHTSALLGSPLYMSPEQMAVDRPLDARSDVHALGVLLWECLTGRAPFSSTSYNLLVVEIMKGPRPKLREAMPAASAELAEIVERAFAIEPGNRFASAAELADALDAQLAIVGGGVLGGRTAAEDLLGGLTLDSNAPPPTVGSTTTVPLSVDPKAQLSPTTLSEGGRPPHRASRTSFAETELATGDQVARPAPPLAVASSTSSEPKPPTSLAVRAAVGILLVAIAGGVGVAVAMHRGPKGVEPVSAEPVPSESSATPRAVSASPPPVDASSAAPSASASASASALPAASAAHAAPAGIAPKKSAAHVSAAASAPTARPRIDQSGL